jgi:hypothetical protein
MFTTDQRAFDTFEDPRKRRPVTRALAAAITGSRLVSGEDEWPDIDLAFALSDGVELMTAWSDWTAYMYEENSAIHHLDIPSGRGCIAWSI